MKHTKCRWQSDNKCVNPVADALDKIVNEDESVCLNCHAYYPLDENELFNVEDNDTELIDLS